MVWLEDVEKGAESCPGRERLIIEREREEEEDDAEEDEEETRRGSATPRGSRVMASRQPVTMRESYRVNA